MVEREFRLLEDEIREILERIMDNIDACTRIRLQAVLLHGIGTPIEKIEARLGFCKSTLTDWCQVYRLMGVEGLCQQRSNGNGTAPKTEQPISVLVSLPISIKASN